MRIAIDLNDVVRDFTYNFLMCYVRGYNHQYDPEDFNETTNDMELALPFRPDDVFASPQKVNPFGRTSCRSLRYSRS